MHVGSSVSLYAKFIDILETEPGPQPLYLKPTLHRAIEKIIVN